MDRMKPCKSKRDLATPPPMQYTGRPGLKELGGCLQECRLVAGGSLGGFGTGYGFAMDIAADRSQPGRSKLEMIKDNSRLFAMGLPLSLDDAALLMIALSFGPLSKNDLVRALKQAGMTMPDGSVITVERLASCVQRLKAKGHITSLGSAMSCPPEMRIRAIEAARR